MKRALVAVSRCAESPCGYPAYPYGPAERYPELAVSPQPGPNPVYAAVRQAFYLLGLDRENYGTPRWNPLEAVIQPGQRILIKPNWVFHENGAGDGMLSLVTHSSVLRVVIDYVVLALKGRGQVTVGDAPLQSADFARLMQQTEFQRLMECLDPQGIELTIKDFRQNVCERDCQGRVLAHREVNDDPEAYCTVDVGCRSHLYPVSSECKRFRVTNYDPRVMCAHHSGGRHEYLIARPVLESDVVISVPKLKMHRKAGVTCLDSAAAAVDEKIRSMKVTTDVDLLNELRKTKEMDMDELNDVLLRLESEA